MKTTIIYIDGQNFLYGISEFLKEANIISDKQEVSFLNFEYLLSKILTPQEKRPLVKYYGVAKIKKQTSYGKTIEKKTVRFADNLRKMRNCLAKYGIQYCATGNLKVRDRDECKKCGAKDYKMQEKGVDVGLAVDIVKDVLERRTNHIILISSDTDLIPALKIAKEKNINITYVARQNHITRSLSRLANQTISLKPEDIIEAYITGQRVK